MRLHRALRHARYCGDAFDWIAVDELQRDACALSVGQTGESTIDIHPERPVGTGCSGARCVEVVGRRAQPAPIVVEHVVGYAEEPCGERRRAAKRPDAGISPYEGVLREVVAQLRVSQRLVEEEAPYRRLILPDKTVESRLVVKLSHLLYKREIVVSILHIVLSLKEWGQWSVSSSSSRFCHGILLS